MGKQVVIDIDGILWPMAEPWQEEIHKINPDCPFPGEGEWEFFKGYLTPEEVDATVKAVHMRQHEFDMFENAPLLGELLKDHGFTVAVASHRHPDSRDSTIKWLEKHGFPHDLLYCTSSNKSFLFTDPTVLVIDDAPHTQKMVIDAGIDAFSIKYPYNKHIEGVNFFEDFNTMLEGVERWIHNEARKCEGELLAQ